jgi:UDP-glucose 4-epimerase
MMSQAIRRAGRVPFAVPTAGVRLVDSVRKATANSEVNRDALDYLSYGRVMDTTRMRTVLGFEPKWTTLEAFDDFVRGRGLTPIIDPEWVRSAEGRALALARRWGGALERLGV